MAADSTAYASEGSWRFGDRVRFRSGFPESIGGWAPINSTTFLGTCRALTAWRTLDSENLLGVGTHLKYYIERGGAYYDITPIRDTTTPTDPFTTITSALAGPITAVDSELTLTSATDVPMSGTLQVGSEQVYYANRVGTLLLGLVRGVNGTVPASHAGAASVGLSSVKVTDSGHGAITGDFVTVSGSGSVDGVPAGSLNKEHQVVVVDNSTYYITTDTFSTSVVTAGGAVTLEYQLNTGGATFVQGSGWGAGGWGSGGWGAGASSGTGNQLRLWNHQNFGEDLIYGPRGGGLFYWDASAGFLDRGVYLNTLAGASDVPEVQNRMLVTESRFVLVFGTNPLGSSIMDPMLIRWSDQELPQVWTPTSTNLAGDLRLAVGSSIITAVGSQREILVWTDSALYSLQFNEQLGFVQSLIADNVSIAGPNAVIVANNMVYWMGNDKFYVYSGRSSTLSSTVDQYVFDDFNKGQSFQVYAGINESFDEVWWFYPSSAAANNDRYVSFNYVDNGWVVGNMERTAWLDAGMRSWPTAASGNRLFSQEFGIDDASVNPPVSLNSYIESADFSIGEGDQYAFVSRVLPDVTFSRSTAAVPTVNMTLWPRVASGAPYRTEQSSPNVARSATVPVEQYTEQVFVRLRGRQMVFRIVCDTVGTAWRLGTPRIDIKMNGRRA
jgi:hypothetical protein